MLFRTPDVPAGASDDEVVSMMSEFSALILNSIGKVQEARSRGDDLSGMDAEKVERMCAIDTKDAHMRFVRSDGQLYLQVE